ncbi:putative saposin B type domain-containing protein [Helianthus annuus]|nr:putative saposin B type domain-containing protein [Helianthus annuus]KAJ0881759.1 putative saposin B type domain-containing protein [Helianthus annuus]KAJ0885793.1 putative saposin B type domain-containing protein [Helianthus annuus]
MAKINQTAIFNLLIICLLLSSSCIQISYSSKSPGVARKDDIPFIKCQVCEKLAKQLYEQVRDKQANISPKKVSEYEVIEISENVCNLKKLEADWILKIDIVEQGDRLELVEQDSEGQCGSECKTIERACQEVIGYYDTDVAEYIYKKKPTMSSLVNFLCKDLTEACSTKPPPVPKGREPGEPFVAKSAKEAEMEKMLKSMEGMPGAPGMKMYSREELMSGKGFNDEDADDDDEDEPSIPSNLGKILREKERSKKMDWKEKITKGIKDVHEATKKHATKMAFRLQKWWKAKKASYTHKKSKSAKVEL